MKTVIVCHQFKNFLVGEDRLGRIGERGNLVSTLRMPQSAARPEKIWQPGLPVNAALVPFSLGCYVPRGFSQGR